MVRLADMKTLTCSDLGGPSGCQHEVSGETFEALGDNCKQHVMMEMQKGDAAHVTAANKMREASPEEQQAMFAAYRKKFDEAPEV